LSQLNRFTSSLSELPSIDEALGILHGLGCSDEVIAHCKLVSRIAKNIANTCKAKGIDVDVDLVVIGGLLHDLGRSKTHSIQHGVLGAKLARKMGLPKKLIRIIERHIGAGISSEEAVFLGLPEKDYLPQTLEEKIVAYADKMAMGDRQGKIDSEIHRLSQELGSSHPAIQRLRNLDREIQSVLKDC
jgi:uncharacterized protein